MSLTYNKSHPQTNNKSRSESKKGRYEIAPPTPDYFHYLQIQPGSSFFKTLAESKYPINTLSLHIPAILINSGIPILLRTGITFFIVDKRGKLKVTENVKINKFIKKITESSDELYEDQPIICIQEVNEAKPWKELEVLNKFNNYGAIYFC